MKVLFKLVAGSPQSGKCLAKSISKDFFEDKLYYIKELQSNPNMYQIYSVELVYAACDIGCGSEPAVCYLANHQDYIPEDSGVLEFEI